MLDDAGSDQIKYLEDVGVISASGAHLGTRAILEGLLNGDGVVNFLANSRLQRGQSSRRRRAARLRSSVAPMPKTRAPGRRKPGGGEPSSAPDRNKHPSSKVSGSSSGLNAARSSSQGGGAGVRSRSGPAAVPSWKKEICL